jgi:hypothetical protein
MALSKRRLLLTAVQAEAGILMKRKTAALAAALLIAALYLFFNPGTLAPATGSLGIGGIQSVYDKTSVVAVEPLNYSYVAVNMATGDSLKVDMDANPGGLDVLLLNQGNFSSWVSSKGGSFDTYPQSALRVSNYSFAFTSSEPSQAFYILLVSHSASQISDALMHIQVTRTSDYSGTLFPLLFGLIGVVLMAYAFAGRRTGDGASRSAQQPPSLGQAQGVSAGSASPFCRHCGAALEPGNAFCPSCNRSQN